MRQEHVWRTGREIGKSQGIEKTEEGDRGVKQSGIE